MTTTYDQLTVTYDQSTLTYQGLPAQFDGVAFAVEMAFGYNPLDDDPSWESVTPYVRGFSTNRGRNSEFVAYSPGTASIRLDNRDRRFDPEYTSGPYFGQLNPMVPVRIQATYSGVTYTLFYGFVQGWPTAYNQSNTDAVATVQCVDATRLLGNTFTFESMYPAAVLAEGPAIYYPLQERGGTSVATVVPSNFLNSSTAWTVSNSAHDATYPISSSTMIDGDFAINTQLDTLLFTYQFRTITFWCDLQGRSLMVSNASSSRFQLTLVTGSSNSQLTIQYTSGGSLYTYTSSPNLNLSSGAHFVVLEVNRVAHTFELNIDGTNVLSGSISVSGSTIFLGSGVTFRESPVSHVATFSVGISSLDLAGLFSIATNPYGGELSSVRLGRALDDSGWPAAWRQIETGVQPVGAYRPGETTIRYMGQVESAEQGALFVNAAGEVEFQSRTTAESVNVAAIFDDGGVDLPFAGVSVDAHTVDAIRNNVVVNYAYGSTTSTDAGSVTAYGRATQTVDAQLVDDPTVAQAIGDNLLVKAKDPRTRITSLNINMRRDPANLIPAVASLDLADDVVVSLTPTGVGDPLWRAVSVQGLSHTVTPQSWDVTMYLGPGPVATNGPLLVLDDDTYGELDNNKLG